MSLTPDVMGDDAHNYQWARSFAPPEPAGTAGGRLT
jgi:hypothetical protein